MEPLTVVIGIIAGAAAASAQKKGKYKGEVSTLPMGSAVPGDLGQDYRFATRISPYSSASQRQIPRLRSRSISSRTQPTYTGTCPQGTQWDSSVNRCVPMPRAQAAPVATTPPAVPYSVPGMQLKGVRVMVSRGPNMPAGDVIYDGKMSSEQMENLQRSIQQNATTAPDHRLISVTITGPGVAMSIWPTQKITPTFAVNLRRLLAAVR